MYKYIVSKFCLQTYLCKPIPELYKKCIIKLRLSSHSLAIEHGRYNAINRNNRKCKFCITDVEDEMYFILLCPLYLGLRSCLIKPYYWKKPSVYKLLQLFNTNNIKELYNLGKYVYRAFKLRNDCMWIHFMKLIIYTYRQNFIYIRTSVLISIVCHVIICCMYVSIRCITFG